MSRRKRTLIAIVAIELVLAGGWIWLHGDDIAACRQGQCGVVVSAWLWPFPFVRFGMRV